MNIYEAIKTNLNEAYEVGINNGKIINAAKDFSNMLENVTNKYITKDVIQAIYKLMNTGDSYLSAFKTDSDNVALEELEKFELSNGETLYLYGPIAISDFNGIDVWSTTSVSIGAPWSDMYGIPAYEYRDSWIWFSPDDGAVGLDYIFDNKSEEDIKKCKESLLAMLEDKQTILQVYKRYCKTLVDNILSKANNMSEERKRDIADKQRKVSNILDK